MRRSEDETLAWEAAIDAALRRVPVPEAPADLRARCLPQSAPVATAADRCVLIVDDEPCIRRLIEVELSRAGYRILQAADGIEALEQVSSDRPDLIVLDVMMPRMGGFEVLTLLKEDPLWCEIPVIMLTARDGDDPIRRGWRIGADFYMTKPFNPAALRSVVDRFAAVIGTPDNPPPLRRGIK